MNWSGIVFLYAKYALALVVVIAIILAPAWIGVQTKKNKTDCALIRIYSWLLGWTGIGWLYALYIATKK
ncbi:MAG: superinfection immunity protein [Alphaproteobacteria bacterium]|nr:superinfection immunity protein [Alphaproteobacteria bacterium]